MTVSQNKKSDKLSRIRQEQANKMLQLSRIPCDWTTAMFADIQTNAWITEDIATNMA